MKNVFYLKRLIMPVYEFECKDCMTSCDRGIDSLVTNLNKRVASNLLKGNDNFLYIEVLNLKNEKTIFSVGNEGQRGIRRFSSTYGVEHL